MEHLDIIVSYFTMPFGVALCFGPAMIVWWLSERRKKAAGEKK